jgi:fucose permease
MGLSVAIVGPSLPALRSQFQLSGTLASFLLSAFWVGTVAGVVVGGVSLSRFAPRQILTVAFALLAVGALAVAYAPSAVLAGIALLVTGFGFGIVDVAVNLLVARSFGDRSAAMLTGLNGCYGIGAIVGPLLVGRTPTDARPPFLLFAIGAMLLVPMTARLRSRALPLAPARPLDGRVLGLLVLTSLLLLGYVAVETGAAGWETTYLRGATTMSDGAAANATSLFWIGLTVGRFLAAPVAFRVPPRVLAGVALVGEAASLALSTWRPAPVLAFGLVGFFCAPVFPTMIAWMSRVVPSGQGATAVFATALGGAAIASPVLGFGSDRWGPHAIPVTLAAFAVASLVLLGVVGRRARAAGLE